MAIGPVKSYDPAQVVAILNGIAVEGYADGTFITASRNNPSFNMLVGSDGEGARAKSNDRGGTIVLTLMQSSLSNDQLATLSQLDEASGDGVGAFLLKDLSGRTLLSAATCWIQQPADVEFAREISNREWTLETNALEMFAGGN